MSTPQHQPVLVTEVLEVFAPKNDDVLLDATVGLGGHSAAYLAARPRSRVVGVDADPHAVRQARRRLAKFGERVQLICSNFSRLKDSVSHLRPSLAQDYGMVQQGYGGQEGGGILSPLFSHILFDLGVGSHQLTDITRGFSFRSAGPLTMRYGEPRNLPPADIEGLNMLERRLGHPPDVREILHGLSEEQLADLIRTYGEERYAGRIAAAIKAAPMVPTSAQQLAELIVSAVPTRRYSSHRRGRSVSLHPATRTFQALRLAVNRELEVLRAALPQAVELLRVGGIIAVISFHSLEDRIVKQFFRARPDLQVLTKKPIRAGRTEVAANSRARSAKLRAARRLRGSP